MANRSAPRRSAPLRIETGRSDRYSGVALLKGPQLSSRVRGTLGCAESPCGTHRRSSPKLAWLRPHLAAFAPEYRRAGFPSPPRRKTELALRSMRVLDTPLRTLRMNIRRRVRLDRAIGLTSISLSRVLGLVPATTLLSPTGAILLSSLALPLACNARRRAPAKALSTSYQQRRVFSTGPGRVINRTWACHCRICRQTGSRDEARLRPTRHCHGDRPCCSGPAA